MSSTTSHYLMLPKSLKERYAYCVVKGYLDSKTMAIALRKTFSDVVEKAMLSAKGVDLNNLDAIRKEVEGNNPEQIDTQLSKGMPTLYKISNQQKTNFEQNFKQGEGFIEETSSVGAKI